MTPLPPGPFSVIYADPPWRFRTWSAEGQDRAPDQHYGTMDIADIKAQGVGAIAAPDAVLFLWVYQPMLREAFDVIEAWGFAYKTVGYIWIKTNGPADQGMLFVDQTTVRKGLGYHTRAGSEQVWIATRGRGYERLSKGEPQVVFAGLREHSRKPDEIADSIVRLTGDVPRVELFARTARPGWSAWGNETGKFAGAA